MSNEVCLSISIEFSLVLFLDGVKYVLRHEDL